MESVLPPSLSLHWKILNYDKRSGLYKLDGDGIGRHTLAMAICAIVYMGSLLILETWWFVIRATFMELKQSLFSGKRNDGVSEAEDENVTAERTRVRNIP